jgi:TonB family protein
VKLTPALERLGVLHFRNGDNTRAEDLYKRAVALKEKEYGAEDVEVAHTLLGLAELYRARRDFNRASPVYRRTLTIYGTRLGVSSPDFQRTSDSYNCLGFETKNDVDAEIKSMWQLLATPGVGGFSGVLNGKAVSLPKPEYPERAREHRLTGFVAVKVTIDESGAVVDALDMCGGPPYLSESSVKAAYKARFTPTSIDGKPIRVYGIIQYNFVRR